MKAHVEIVHADGSTESFPVSGDEATVGRSLSAEISIPDARELEQQHLRLRPQPSGCMLEVLEGVKTPVLVSGSPFQSGTLPWGAEVAIGELRLRIVAGEAQSRFGLGSILGVAVIVGAAALVYVVLTRQQIELELSANRNAPDILVSSVDCPFEGEQARRKGETLAEDAEAKSDRYPFDPQDGILAIEMYAYAESCFVKAGEEQSAKRIASRAKPLRKRIERDYQTHRLRLERALEAEQDESALAAALELHRFVKHTSGEYRSWLLSSIQKLRLRLSREDES